MSSCASSRSAPASRRQDVKAAVHDDLELIRRFDGGVVTPAVFHARVMALSGAAMSYGEFYEIYNDIFTPNPPVLEVLRAVKAAGYKILLLSNTDPERFAFSASLSGDPVLRRLCSFVRAQSAQARSGHLPCRGAPRRRGAGGVRLHRRHGRERPGRRRGGSCGDHLSAGHRPRSRAEETGAQVLSHLPRTWTQAWRARGPSNSQKNIPCHLPSRSRPSSTMSAADEPARAALTWAGEFPSPWA